MKNTIFVPAFEEEIELPFFLYGNELLELIDEKRDCTYVQDEDFRVLDNCIDFCGVSFPVDMIFKVRITEVK